MLRDEPPSPRAQRYLSQRGVLCARLYNLREHDWFCTLCTDFQLLEVFVKTMLAGVTEILSVVANRSCWILGENRANRRAPEFPPWQQMGASQICTAPIHPSRVLGGRK